MKSWDWHAALAALAWQVDLGVTEVIGETTCDAYALPDRMESPPAGAATGPAGRAPRATAPPAAQAISALKPGEVATRAAAAAPDLAALHAAMEAFDHCELKKGARSTVFSDGLPGAQVMIVGEAPGREEDRTGRPFVGQAGQMLDRMFAAIGLSRMATDPACALYITNTMPWRPPQNRDPSPEEIAMMRPFLLRHIELARPRILVATGNTACSALFGQRGILRLRGQWQECNGIPVLPITHPSYLLREPSAKREAWADLLDLRARLAAPDATG
ncbi:MAG: uracil-DNA glycosylase [Pseudorhodobacter sp.]